MTERTESETAGRQAVQSALAPCPDTSFPETTGIRCAYGRCFADRPNLMVCLRSMPNVFTGSC
ncbi:TPA: hypothetical protein ACRZMU_003924, partial [Escherichia coli]